MNFDVCNFTMASETGSWKQLLRGQTDLASSQPHGGLENDVAAIYNVGWFGCSISFLLLPVDLLINDSCAVGALG